VKKLVSAALARWRPLDGGGWSRDDEFAESRSAEPGNRGGDLRNVEDDRRGAHVSVAYTLV